jgi:hypothetical protein
MVSRSRPRSARPLRPATRRVTRAPRVRRTLRVFRVRRTFRVLLVSPRRLMLLRRLVSPRRLVLLRRLVSPPLPVSPVPRVSPVARACRVRLACPPPTLPVFPVPHRCPARVSRRRLRPSPAASRRRPSPAPDTHPATAVTSAPTPQPAQRTRGLRAPRSCSRAGALPPARVSVCWRPTRLPVMGTWPVMVGDTLCHRPGARVSIRPRRL